MKVKQSIGSAKNRNILILMIILWIHWFRWNWALRNTEICMARMDHWIVDTRARAHASLSSNHSRQFYYFSHFSLAIIVGQRKRKWGNVLLTECPVVLWEQRYTTNTTAQSWPEWPQRRKQVPEPYNPNPWWCTLKSQSKWPIYNWSQLFQSVSIVVAAKLLYSIVSVCYSNQRRAATMKAQTVAVVWLLRLCAYAKVAAVTVLCLWCDGVRCWPLPISRAHSHTRTAISLAPVSMCACRTFRSHARCYSCSGQRRWMYFFDHSIHATLMWIG